MSSKYQPEPVTIIVSTALTALALGLLNLIGDEFDYNKTFIDTRHLC